MVAACAASELHEIGVRMAADFFEMEGWDTFYLGANTPAESVIRTLVERKADVLAVSATIQGGGPDDPGPERAGRPVLRRVEPPEQ